MERGKCLVMREGERPGKVAKNPRSTACFHVVSEGLQHARCKYFARSFFVRRLYTFAAWEVYCCWFGLVGAGLIEVSQSPPGLLLSAVRTTSLVLMLATVASFCLNHASYPASQNCPTEYSDLYARSE